MFNLLPAMDVQSSKAEAPERTLDEKMSEKFSTGVGSSTTNQTHLSVDTHTSNFRNSTLKSPATARTPDVQTAEENAHSHHSTLRTLPGSLLSLALY